MPAPGFHNIVMEGGEDSLESLYAQVNNGLCIDRMLGTFTSNFLAGQVSGNISLGYKVADGKRLGRIKDAALNINTFDAFTSKIVGISSERHWVGKCLLPYVLLEDVVISAS